ncbi:bifunctional apoptosis regulator-like [Antedon mediterranea]|uniref:bifunctional apoptosis regulator-like n=1 Tax=Antedon mediterranea TaxID=105859 RepID=UPI003AF42604
MAGSYNQKLHKRRRGDYEPEPPDDFLPADPSHQHKLFVNTSSETLLSEQSAHVHRTTGSDHAIDSVGQIYERSVTVRDFTCACCSDLMISPTTINCGHSFCRLCIAQWWKTSGTCTCPLCRQEWAGFPNVNFILRSTIEKACTDRYRERSLLLKENSDILEEFEVFGRRQKDGKLYVDKQSKYGFWWGTLLTLLLIYIVYILWNWRSSDHDLLIHKPVCKWSVVDVSTWVSSLGVGAHSQYSQVFMDNAINGEVLLSMSDSVLQAAPFNIDNSFHRQAILRSLNTLREIGTKSPTDFWEYKALNPGLSLLLVYAMKDYPRVTLAYLYWFKYDEVFLPFLLATCPSPHSVHHFAPNTLQSGSYVQFMKFTAAAIIMPYYLTARFAWEWIHINTCTALCVIVNSLLIMLIEFKRLRRFIASRGQGFLREFFKRYTSGLLLLAVSSLVYIILPAILCDFFLYLGLYLSPILNFYDLYLAQNQQRL